MTDKTIKVKLVRSLAGTPARHRATVRGLGLKRLNHTVELADSPAVRGMLERVNYLVRLL